jgi:phospholipid/cholesterol/gamma-HCH transport system permease protein
LEGTNNIEKKSWFIRFIENLQDYTLMVFDFFKSLKRVFKNIPNIYNEMYLIGAQSFLLVFLSGLFMGIILSLEVGYRFASFGAKTIVGRTVALGMIRELGPVITGILLAARTGSKNTSEIGSMVLSEQVDALRAFGTSPIEKLVLPRTVASLIMFLPLTLIADFVGIMGGMLVSNTSLSVDTTIYWNAAIYGLQIKDLFIGFMKPVAFGFFISTISCFYGLKTEGGTTGLGRAVINSVVVSSMIVLILDFIFTKVVWEIM